MIQPPEQTYLSTCPVCQKQIDVTSLEPFTKLKCPFCGSMVRVRRKFDHFVIVRQIGEGGMSRVFEAEDETLGRRVALKILNRQYGRDAVRVGQFRQEALVTAKVSHLNVIKLYSVGYDQGYFYIAMELVGGGSLEQRIRREGALKEKEVLRIGREVADGLRAAQQQGLIHRDVKPANILFTETGTAKVVDFGLALFADRGGDESGEIWATPYYVAPEKIIDNREDYRSDIFSLGASLYHALIGRPPHKAETNSLQELRMIKCRRVALEESGLRFAPRTAHAVNRMLAFKPEDRFANYDEVVEELRLAEGLLGQPVFRLASRRTRWIAGAAAAVVLAFVIGWMTRSGGGRQAASFTDESETAESALSGDGVILEAGRRTVAERFVVARELMLKERKFAEAGHQFERLVKSGEARQPTLNWARFNAALCAILIGRNKEAASQFIGMAASDAGTSALVSPELADFFKNLGARMSRNLGIGTPVTELTYSRKDEQLLGYLVQGLAEWHFGDALRGAEEMELFLEHLSRLERDPASAGTAPDWVPLYAAVLQPYQADIVLARTLRPPPKPADIASCRKALDALEALENKLQTQGTLRSTLAKWRASLTRDMTRMKFEEQRASLASARARRQRELVQLEEINAALPALVQGYDYSRVIDSLRDIRFESHEVQSALEGRRYLYEQSQAFINQLMRDIAASGYQGTITRREGAPIEAVVTAADLVKITLTLDRGVLTLPLDSITPHCLINMAQHYLKTITDSTDYYRREEMIAAFARMTGLQSLSATLAAQLMEENRDFRLRWMKAVQ